MALHNLTPPPPNGGPAGPGGPGGGIPSMARLASGAGIDVEDLLVDYNERFKSASPTMYRDDLIAQTISVLIGSLKPNAMLVGAAGVGKTKIVEDIARRIAIHDPLIPATLARSVIYELPLSSLVAGAGIVGQLEERVTQVIDFAVDPSNHAILFIDEIHMLMSHSETYQKIGQILKPALARGDLRVIGATTLQEARDIDDDPALSRRFSRLIVDELDREQTVQIMKMALPRMMAHYGNQVGINDDTLGIVAILADEYAKAGQHRPDSALTLLDRSMADVVMRHSRMLNAATQANNQSLIQALQTSGLKMLSETVVRNTARRLMTGLAQEPVFNEAELRLALEGIKGQVGAVDEVISMLRRDALGIYPRTTPLAWMFAGASGVGKTQVAKVISTQLTGQKPITLNMTEYHSPASINRIIGSPAGYVGSDSNTELPFDSLEANPYRVVLLDEFEKADRSVQRLFLSALDEGYIRTSRGKQVDFSKAILIVTTNAARDKLSSTPLGFGASAGSKAQAIATDLSEWFDTELLGRFSAIVSFSPITTAVYREILVSAYASERERVLTDRPSLALPTAIPDGDLDDMVTETYVKSQGARPAERAVQRWLEDALILAQSATPAWHSSSSASVTVPIGPMDDED